VRYQAAPRPDRLFMSTMARFFAQALDPKLDQDDALGKPTIVDMAGF